jgi:hypothetical protein
LPTLGRFGTLDDTEALMSERVIFSGSEGVRWVVYPVPGRHVEHNDEVIDETPPHLCFEAQIGSTVLLRRVDRYPESWRELDRDELVRLSGMDALVETALQHEESPASRRAIDRLET